METYEGCLSKGHKGTLCPRGYCTAKLKYKVYPSAYANGYAVSVCKGKMPDHNGVYGADWDGKDGKHGKQGKPAADARIKDVSLSRWYREKWVNICNKRQDGTYAPCGRKVAILDPSTYPYCRPLHKLTGTKVVTAGQLLEADKAQMCRAKRSQGQPSRVTVSEQLGGSGAIVIPEDVRSAAKLGLQLVSNGFLGGTETGWKRAEQLQGGTIDIDSLADMRTWFARHGPDAINGGTSYPGYLKWVEDGRPTVAGGADRRAYRGAVAWLIWGGDDAYLWIKSGPIRAQLERTYPDRKSSVPENNLI